MSGGGESVSLFELWQKSASWTWMEGGLDDGDPWAARQKKRDTTKPRHPDNAPDVIWGTCR